MNYQPKGSQCAACTKKHDDCSKLDFSKMRKHEVAGSIVVVICSEFKKENTNELSKVAL